MGVSVALFLIGWTALAGCVTVMWWKRFTERPAGDSVRSVRFAAFGCCLVGVALAAAPGAVLVGRAFRPGWVVAYVFLAGLLAWIAARLALAAERSHTERVRRGRGSTPRQRLLPVGVVASFWLLPTFVGVLAVGFIVVWSGSAAEIRDPAEPPPGVPGFVAVVSIGLLGALVTGMWQHHRRNLEDARILRSDMEDAAQALDGPDRPAPE